MSKHACIGLALAAVLYACTPTIPETLMTIETLHPCPSTPNCVCSESFCAKENAINPIAIEAQSPEEAWKSIAAVIQQLGGRIQTHNDTYLHAVFTTRWLRFKDDVELRMAGEVIHIRSASRVGYSDFGVNRRRVEKIRAAFTSKD